MTGKMILKFRRLPHCPGLPVYATDGAAGMDICAGEDTVIPPGRRSAIPTGLCPEVPPGHELQIRPRSGLARNCGIMVVNSPGTVDEDFRGEIVILLLNTSSYAVSINRGDRIAQAVLAPVIRAQIVEVEELSETARGGNGFGSTAGVSSQSEK